MTNTTDSRATEATTWIAMLLADHDRGIAQACAKGDTPESAREAVIAEAIRQSASWWCDKAEGQTYAEALEADLDEGFVSIVLGAL
jgi:hypothetical protein